MVKNDLYHACARGWCDGHLPARYGKTEFVCVKRNERIIQTLFADDIPVPIATTLSSLKFGQFFPSLFGRAGIFALVKECGKINKQERKKQKRTI